MGRHLRGREALAGRGRADDREGADDRIADLRLGSRRPLAAMAMAARGPSEVQRPLMIAPDSCRSMLREGVVAVPVVDAPQVTAVIAWPPHSRSLAVAGLVQTALRL